MPPLGGAPAPGARCTIIIAELSSYHQAAIKLPSSYCQATAKLLPSGPPPRVAAAQHLAQGMVIADDVRLEGVSRGEERAESPHSSLS